jgi:mannose-6-phosphate isomerase-like protein (cupin superfamily)
MDEINIVTSGSSSFEVDGETMEIAAMSIVYVEQGAGHRFHSLGADLDVLILWGR